MASMIAVGLTGAITGQALAWQNSQLYQADTLYNQTNGKAWSPTAGQLSGKVVREGGQRRTYAEANYQKWNQTAINWMNGSFFGGTPSITFHIFASPGDSCSNWTSIDWSWTNLPGASRYRPLRGCGYNEVRVQADRTKLVANTNYVAQVVFYDTSAATNSPAKVVVDTYWNGDGNYHQHYCIPGNSDTTNGRNACN